MALAPVFTCSLSLSNTGGIGDLLLLEVVVLSGSWHTDCFIGLRG
jgi:hypothetical protein